MARSDQTDSADRQTFRYGAQAELGKTALAQDLKL